MIFVNGYKISENDLEKFNEELKNGSQKVVKIEVTEKGNIKITSKNEELEGN